MISPILPLYDRLEANFSHGLGAYLYTAQNEKFLDFTAGYAANSLGHCHPKLVEAISKQVQKLWHISNRYNIPGMEQYCQRLTELSFADTCFIANSGAEAVECMIKMCRRYFNDKGQLNKYKIITFEGAFHGRTLATASAGTAEKIVGFEPAIEGFIRVKWNDIADVKKAISADVAGILIEPIQGEGGMRAASPAFLKDLEALCRENDILLLLDEVQSGMGRTGHLFAYEKYGIRPDLMSLGKGLGCGFPISACLATESVGRAMKKGTHGSTFGGNPLAIAVGSAVLDVMTAPDFLPQINRISDYLHKVLTTLQKNNPDLIADITGTGLMVGLKFHDHVDIELMNKCCNKAYLLSLPAAQNILRITPALIIGQSQIDEAYEKFTQAFKAYKLVS
jgi:acetylornithine/N-succinyldiaminopimelate aminotransferase